MGRKWLSPQEKRERLEEIADQANSLHVQAITAWRNALKHAKSCGELLIEAKRLLGGRGKWGRWVDREFHAASRRTARVYMQIARHWDDPRIEQARVRGMEPDSIHGFLRFVKHEPLDYTKRTVPFDPDCLYDWLTAAAKKLSFNEREVFLENFDKLWKVLHKRLKRIIYVVDGPERERYSIDDPEIVKLRRRTKKRLNKSRAVAQQAGAPARLKVKRRAAS